MPPEDKAQAHLWKPRWRALRASARSAAPARCGASSGRSTAPTVTRAREGVCPIATFSARQAGVDVCSKLVLVVACRGSRRTRHRVGGSIQGARGRAFPAPQAECAVCVQGFKGDLVREQAGREVRRGKCRGLRKEPSVSSDQVLRSIHAKRHEPTQRREA